MTNDNNNKKSHFSIYIPRIFPHEKIEYDLIAETDSLIEAYELSREAANTMGIDKKCIWVKYNRNPKDNIGI